MPDLPREALSFRALAGRFPAADLADVLAEGMERGHPAMPNVRSDPGNAADHSAYLKAPGRRRAGRVRRRE